MTVMDKPVVRLPVVYQLVAEYGDELLLAFVLRADADDAGSHVVPPRSRLSVDSELHSGQPALKDFAVKAVKPVVAHGARGDERTRGGS